MVNKRDYGSDGPAKDVRQDRKYNKGYRKGVSSPYKRQYRRHRIKLEQKREEKPMPIGGKCNPLCPLFYCTQRALVVMNKQVRGHIQKAAVCRLTGSECIGAECQYAACRINSLLPDGRCAKALEVKRRPSTDEELFREMESIEDYEVEDFIRS